jgi:hypothetical protein
LQTFQDGYAPANQPVVSGLDGAVAVAVSPDGNNVYVLGAGDSEIAVFARGASGELAFERAIAVSGIGTPTSLVVSGSAGSRSDLVFVGGSGGVAAFQGDTATDQLAASTANTAVASISGLAVSRDGSLVYAVSASRDSLYVLDSSGLATVGTYTTSSVTAANSAAPANTLEGASGIAVSQDDQYVYVIGGSSGTLAVFRRDLSTNAMTWVQTLQDGVDGIRGLTGADGVVVSTDGKYVEVTSGSGSSLTVFGIQSDGTLMLDQVLRGSLGLGQPSGLAVDPADDTVFVASQAGLGFGGGGLASFVPAAAQAASSLSVSYSNIQTLNVQLGNGDNSLGETHYATTGPGSSTPAQLNIIVGNGANTIDLLDIGGTTTVTTGSGPNNVTASPGAISADTNATLTIDGGAGVNFVELDSAAKGDVIAINLGSGNSTAQVEGTALDPTAQITIDGGQGFDTLLFDAKGGAINAYDPSGNRIAGGQPDLPNGQIQVFGGSDPRVIYNQISSIPGFVGATISAGTYPPLAEGQGITLAGTATAATGSTILSAAWDLTGRGTFGDATGLTPTLTWAQLAALGLNHPGTYPIALRVYSTTNTVTAYSTLTITAVAPTVTVSPAPTATAGVPYTINFSGQEVAGVNYGITGWTINWGDGTPGNPDITTLPGDATSATHTFTTPGSDTVSVTEADPYFPATSVSQAVAVSVGAQSINAGGPYAIAAGNGLTLTATAYGTPTAFNWDLGGKGTFTDATTTTISTVGGISTGQVTLSWAQLESLGIDEGTYADVRVEAVYAGGPTAISAPTTLVIQPTAPTTTFTGTSAVLGGTSTVSFTNPFDPSAAQTHDGFTYSYDFYDNGTFEIAGSTSPTAAVPADLLAQPGSFIVHGRITAADGTYTDYDTTITVSDAAPTVTVGPNQTITAGTPFTLSGVTFSDPGYATAAAGWGFTASMSWGDGTTSAGTLAVHQGSAGVPTTGTVSGSHLYQPGQTYTVTVTVEDADGAQGSGSFEVTVDVPTVTVVPGPTETVGAGAVFIPSQAGFLDNAAPDATTATINWGDGSAVQAIPASLLGEPASPADLGTIGAGHIYGYPGNYTVTLSVTNTFGSTDTGSFQVDVLDVPPTVLPGPNVPQSPGTPISVGATFTDPGFPVGGSAETYTASINWGDGTSSPGTVTETPGSAGVPTTGTVSGSHTYGKHGTFPVTVTVLDSLGGQASATLTAQDVPPTVTAGANPTVNQGSPAVVAATFSDPGFEAGASAASYAATIDWGDGTTSLGTVTVTPGRAGVPTTGTIAGSHIYADQGSYIVTVSLADDGGGVGQATLTATVKDVGPTLAPLPNGVYTTNQPFTIVEPFTEPGIADRDTVTVSWGDGTSNTVDDASTYLNAHGVLVPNIVEPTATTPGRITLGHEFGDTSNHTVTITITDKDGLSSTVSALYVYAIPTTTTVVSSTAGNTSVYGQPLTFTATVAPLAGYPSPSGTVTFDVNGVPAAQVALSGGVAQYTPSPALAPGSYTITAYYSGAGADLPSDNTAAPLMQTVTQDATTTTLTASPVGGTLAFGEPVTFTAAVAANSPGSGTPTGTVDFVNASTGTDYGRVALSGGTATWTISGLAPGSHIFTATYSGDPDFLTSTSSAGAAVSVGNSILVLNKTAAYALEISGGSYIDTSGLVEDDSNSSSALLASGGATIQAGSIQVVGGVQITGGASVSPKPVTGVGGMPDPLANLPVPAAGPSRGSVNLGGSSTLTINPGVYTAINVAGNATLTLSPGIYEIAGGGFSVSGSGKVDGAGVLIYNAGSKYPNPGGTFGAIKVSGAGTVQLSPATSGIYAGIVLFQSRDNTQTITYTGGGVPNFNGLVYAPAALLSVTGGVHLPATSYVVNELDLSGGASIGSASVKSASSPVAPPRGPLAIADQGSDPSSIGALGLGSPLTFPSSPCTTKVKKSVPSSVPTSRGFARVLPNQAATTGDGEESLLDLDSETLADVAISLLGGKSSVRKG